MPTYSYRCTKCEVEFEKMLRIANYKDPQDCPECGTGPAKKLITVVNFNLPGDDFPGKNNRIAGQMRRKNNRLDKKQDERKFYEKKMTLAPNVEGEQTDSWGDAAKLAKEKGKSTAGYERLARKEKKEAR